MPDCWETCGACSGGDILVSDLFIEVGFQVMLGDPIMEIETDKTTLEIPAPCSGEVLRVYVDIGDELDQETPIVQICQG